VRRGAEIKRRIDVAASVMSRMSSVTKSGAIRLLLPTQLRLLSYRLLSYQCTVVCSGLDSRYELEVGLDAFYMKCGMPAPNIMHQLA